MRQASLKANGWRLRCWLIACTGSESLYPSGERMRVLREETTGSAVSPFSWPELRKPSARAPERADSRSGVRLAAA